MTRILSSIDGRKSGTTSDGRMMSVAGFVSGDHGSQINAPSPSRATIFDDFEGDSAILPNRWKSLEGTDSATSDAKLLAGGIGGVLRLTTGDAGTGLAADEEEIVQALQWQASNGELVFEARVKLSAITTCWAFLGFTDDATTLEGPIISAGAGDTFTTNASDAVGFMFDTRMSTKNWWLTGVAADVDATMQNSGIAPVAAQYATFRIAINASGTATFYINGVEIGTAMTGALTPATDLTPVLAVSKTSVAASMTMDVDYVHVSMLRAANGGAA